MILSFLLPWRMMRGYHEEPLEAFCGAGQTYFSMVSFFKSREGLPRAMCGHVADVVMRVSREQLLLLSSRTIRIFCRGVLLEKNQGRMPLMQCRQLLVSISTPALAIQVDRSRNGRWLCTLYAPEGVMGRPSKIAMSSLKSVVHLI